MFLNRLKNFLFTETFISFYKKEHKFEVLKESIKREKIIDRDRKEFDNEEEFIKFIEQSLIENTQTYISTLINNFNQGIVDSCSAQKYRELGINSENIKIICLGKHSIFIELYELNMFKKEIEKFKVDFIFSPYLIIEFKQYRNSKNILYVLITEELILNIAYKNNKPIYSNIHQFQIEDETLIDNSELTDEQKKDNDIDLIDDIDDIEEIEGLDEINDIEELEELDNELEQIENIEDIEVPSSPTEQAVSKEEIEKSKMEIEIIEFLKNSVKEYYNESPESDFIEKIVIFAEEPLKEEVIINLKEELLLDIESKKIDILEILNQIAKEEVNYV